MEEIISLKETSDFSLILERIRNKNLRADIDISEFKYFYPKDILILVQYFVIQNYHQIDGSLLLSDVNGWYIQSINLIEFCNTNYKIPSHVKPTSRTAIPIKRVDTSTMNGYIRDAQNFFAKYCQGKDISALNICIAEIINNVSDHSRSEHDSFIFSQYYKHPKTIVFAISDVGVGIPDSVNGYMRSIGTGEFSDFEAVDWALQKGRSVKSKAHNMGAGFDNIINHIRGIGNIQIFTGGVYCQIDKNGDKYIGVNPINNFIGTIIEITINTTKLEPIDETILDGYTF